MVRRSAVEQLRKDQVTCMVGTVDGMTVAARLCSAPPCAEEGCTRAAGHAEAQGLPAVHVRTSLRGVILVAWTERWGDSYIL